MGTFNRDQAIFVEEAFGQGTYNVIESADLTMYTVGGTSMNLSVMGEEHLVNCYYADGKVAPHVPVVLEIKVELHQTKTGEQLMVCHDLRNVGPKGDDAFTWQGARGRIHESGKSIHESTNEYVNDDRKY